MRGVRQGDPLSPDLFILCAEGLSSLIQHFVRQRWVKGMKLNPEAPVLHHLLFADDSFLFGTADEEECQHVHNILYTYEIASGQQINLQKSSVAFSRHLDLSRQLALAQILGVHCVDKHDRYLGLPTHVGRSKSAAFSYLKEKLSKMLISWRAKLLSGAGKEILIKAVSQTVPNYVMTSYMFPEGGTCPSFLWRSIMEAREVLIQGLRWRVGNGENIEIWRDRWIPDSYPRCPSSPPPQGAPQFVAELIDPILHCWDTTKLEAYFSPADIDLILFIPLGRRRLPDRLIWHFQKQGLFTTNSAYYVAKDVALSLVLAPPLPLDPFQDLWKAIWSVKVPGNVALHAWRSCSMILPTRVALSRKGYSGDMGCLLCPSQAEDAYLFVQCPYAPNMWDTANIVVDTTHRDFKEFLLALLVAQSKEQFAKSLVVLWAIWKNRNLQLWEGKQ
ncbi:uncharacterized protein LOC133731938 [Rosa rugosa]|uniref:uncharacterized protein LOC133731938 n=1 Tax=Rosa rugosa TaxID=74645 RepID=UPI002B400BFD|nr:uncharacterized protein LOC133731938 [Rosa rugosa]